MLVDAFFCCVLVVWCDQGQHLKMSRWFSHGFMSGHTVSSYLKLVLDRHLLWLGCGGACYLLVDDAIIVYDAGPQQVQHGLNFSGFIHFCTHTTQP